LLILTLAAFGLVCALELGWTHWPRAAGRTWPEGLVLALGVLLTITWHSRRLPLEAVLLACFIIAFISSGIFALGVLTALPFGPFRIGPNFGPVVFDCLPFAIPGLWIFLVLSARGVARLALRRFRFAANYGLWVIGATLLLLLGFAVAFEPVASQVKQYWTWQATKTTWKWYEAPWATFLGWILTSLLIVAFATPPLIQKKPGRQTADYFPLATWIMLVSWVVLVLTRHSLQAAAWVGGALLVISTAAALVGAANK
jgi:uncharacterized membrane protein